MNTLPACILYTQNDQLLRQADAYLQPVASVRHVADPQRLEASIDQVDPTVVIFDLCADDARRLLRSIRAACPGSAVIALGLEGSDPFLEAEDLGAFAVESADFSRQRLRKLVIQAADHVRLQREVKALRQRIDQSAQTAAAATAVAGPATNASISQFSRMFRRFEDSQAVCESIVEGVAECTRTSRVGLFTLGSGGAVYHLRAHVRALEESRVMTVPRDSALARWMQIHAHIVSRSTIAQLEELSDQVLLGEMLDALGAELLVPLQGRENLLGWLFVGKRATGMPFSTAELDEIAVLSDTVTLTLENALLYEEMMVQKTLAETVLHSIPVGIVAVDSDCVVRTINKAAEMMLEVAAETITERPLSLLDNRLVGLIGKCLGAGESSHPDEDRCDWVNPVNHKALSATARRLSTHGHCMGALAIIHDCTQEELLREKQDNLDRAVFWTELAAAISHEVRNPLVAINTFAQLLPERYSDEEFRTEFRDLATSEISRLDKMVDQINDFANPPPLQFKIQNIDHILVEAVDAALERVDSADRVDITKSVKSGTPRVWGDRHALADCFAHLLANAIEALTDAASPTIRIRAEVNGGEKGGRVVVVRIQDNGHGVPANIYDKIFSPFCTTKARGIGLGLPIVKRTLIDHNGHLDIQTDKKGTTVTVVLPAHDGQT